MLDLVGKPGISFSVGSQETEEAAVLLSLL